MPTKSKLLTRKLRSLGRTLVLTELSRRLAIALATAILLLATLTLTDALLELPLGTRKLLLAAATTITGALVARAFITPITQHRDAEELALLTEQRHPSFDSRLISAVQLTGGKATGASQLRGNHCHTSPVLRSMVADTEAIARETNLLDAVDLRGLGRVLLALLAVAAVATTAFFALHGITPTLVQRAFLKDIPIPRDTQILTTTGDLRVGIGDQVEVAARAGGVLPDDASLHIRFASGRKLDYSPGRSGPTYTTQIDDVPESFTYQFRINDARSERFEVKAFARPVVESLSASQTYPAYTGIEPTRHLPGDFFLFPGSQVELQLTASKPLERASLRLVGLGREIPISTASMRVRFEVPTEGLSGLSITLRDTDGMDSRDPAVYRTEILGDEPPEVRITHPVRREISATRGARCLIAFEATDRFGIAEVSLNFRINGDPDPHSQKLDIGRSEQPQTALKNQYEWQLGEIEPALQVGDVVEFWITAQDRKNVTPATGESDHLLLQIVSSAQKRQELLGRASDYLDGVGATTEKQRRLNSELGELIRAKAQP